jgi:hypothetical protein
LVKKATDEQVAPQLPARELAAADAKLRAVESEVQDKVSSSRFLLVTW